MKQFINNNQIKKFMRPQCCGREWDVKAKKKDIAIDPEGCMMREAKANLARIVYMLVKRRMAGEVPTYLTA